MGKEIYVESNFWFMKIKKYNLWLHKAIFNYCWPWLRIDKFTWKSDAFEQSLASSINLCHVSICILRTYSIFRKELFNQNKVHFFKISKTFATKGYFLSKIKKYYGIRVLLFVMQLKINRAEEVRSVFV